MQRVLVLSSDRKPLDPCTPASARLLLDKGRAAVFRRYPFTIILKDRTTEQSTTSTYRIKIDPGSKTTGFAVVNEISAEVVWAAELQHRGQAIKASLDSRRAIRRNRRNRKTRYRQARFLNRAKPKGWLPPSLLSRVYNVTTWVDRLRRLIPITAISMELVRFDTQLMQSAEIKGVEYQQGELAGYEVREYLLEKWGRKCAYCGKKSTPLEIEHIIPKARGGSDRVSNLTLACHKCNQKKGTKTAAEFGYPEIQAQAKRPLRDTAAVNATRWKLFEELRAMEFPVEIGTGGRTKYNRTRLGFPKTHWLDAACVGISTPEKLNVAPIGPLLIKASGHGHRQMCGINKHGFPIRHRLRRKSHFGFKTGDIIKAIVPFGKRSGIHIGKVTTKASGNFDVSTSAGKAPGINHRRCHLLHHADGYQYLT